MEHYRPYLQLLVKPKLKERVQILKTVDNGFIKLLVEATNNILRGNVPLKKLVSLQN